MEEVDIVEDRAVGEQELVRLGRGYSPKGERSERLRVMFAVKQVP